MEATVRMFVTASNAVSAPAVRKSDKIQLFPGDMYQSCPDACALLVSDSFPHSSNDNTAQYSCIPLQVHLFVLGPLKCDKHLTVVLLTVKQHADSSKSSCVCKSHFGLYSPCAGTVRLRNGTSLASTAATRASAFAPICPSAT